MPSGRSGQHERGAAFSSFPEYLPALEPVRAKPMRFVLSLGTKSVPNGTPVISYGTPAFKPHIGVFRTLRDPKRRATLAPYVNAKGNLGFPMDELFLMPLIAIVAKAMANKHAGSP